MKTKNISIIFSEGDLCHLLNGEVFNWTFKGVDVELFKGCSECEEQDDDCTCGNNE